MILPGLEKSALGEEEIALKCCGYKPVANGISTAVFICHPTRPVEEATVTNALLFCISEETTSLELPGDWTRCPMSTGRNGEQ